MRVIVASTNPVKIEAARQAFMAVFPEADLSVQGIEVASGVSAQPMTDAETLAGARGRAEQAHLVQPEADFWVGIEGGVQPAADGALWALAWMAILAPGRVGLARSASYRLPDEVTRLIHQGMELGHADDVVFGRSNSKQQNGSTGLLTHDLIDRMAYYRQPLILALIPFMNPGLSFGE